MTWFSLITFARVVSNMLSLLANKKKKLVSYFFTCLFHGIRSLVIEDVSKQTYFVSNRMIDSASIERSCATQLEIKQDRRYN